jgi:hypothetical protein
MNRKILSYFLILILVVSSCVFAGCLDSGSSSNNSTTSSTSSQTVKSTGPVGISEADFQNAANATKLAFNEIYFIDDMTFRYNQSNNEITVVISVLDTTKGLLAKTAAENVLKRLNNEIRYYNSSVRPSGTNYYGGLYDECRVTIYVVPKNNMWDRNYWYVNQTILKGTHRTIRLESMYASGSMYV